MPFLVASLILVLPGATHAHEGGDCTRQVTPTTGLPPTEPGDVVCFAPGTYTPLLIVNVHGRPTAPVVFRRAPGHDESPTFTSGSLDHGTAITVINSSHIELLGLRATNSGTGVSVEGSEHIRLAELLVESIGQAGIHVGRTRSATQFLGPPSHHVDVVKNTIRDTGLVTARYGEGIYVGTGGLAGDDTHHVGIEGNHIERVRAEGIDVKAYTHDILIRGNLVAHGTHYFHAAITVGVSPRSCPGPADYTDANYLIEDNVVFDFRRVPPPTVNHASAPVAGIGVGHGKTVVRGNTVWDVPGGAAIELYSTFGTATATHVTVDANAIWNPRGRGLVVGESDQGTCVTGRNAKLSWGDIGPLPP